MNSFLTKEEYDSCFQIVLNISFNFDKRLVVYKLLSQTFGESYQHWKYILDNSNKILLDDNISWCKDTEIYSVQKDFILLQEYLNSLNTEHITFSLIKEEKKDNLFLLKIKEIKKENNEKIKPFQSEIEKIQIQINEIEAATNQKLQEFVVAWNSFSDVKNKHYISEFEIKHGFGPTA